MTKFAVIKSEVEASTDQQLWGVIRWTILSTEEACLRYVYARAELSKRGFNI